MRKLELTVSEMRRLRDEGYSNKDIAAMLECSIQTVYTYIGKQGRKIESVMPQNRATEPPQIKAQDEPPTVKTVSETVAINGWMFRRDGDGDTLIVFGSNELQSIDLPLDDMDKFKDAITAAQTYFNGKRGGR